MEKLNLKINGIQVTARPGQTILDVAREQNILIPTLCHDDRLKPFGSCMLCRVEVEGARGNMLACATPVTDGMVVRSETDAVNESRKTCLELLLSQHYGDCTAPCSMTCPAGIDVQGYIAHIANGQYQEAVKLIKEKNPLPLVCGRVCTRPCEDECRRNLVDERVGIDYLKRFASDYDLNSGNPYVPERKPASGKKVAVIGAGPAGLSCANYLAREGHTVTIFERWPRGGGMLRYGIPAYRLPKDVLDKEIDLIKALGVEIRYNTTFGKDVTTASLKKDGYAAIFLGVGSQVGTKLGCDGEEGIANILAGVEFLGTVGLGQPADMTGKKVIVVGGGNTAVDAARTAIRLGASEVKMAYRRTKAEMPAHEMEIEEAEFEGVHIVELVATDKVAEINGRVALTLYRMELGEMDASGRRSPVRVAGSEFVEECDYVIAAIGQDQDLSFISSDFALNAVRNRIQVDQDLMTTNIEGVFAGGDVVTGPKTAIAAIAAGRQAALAIDQFVRGQKLEKLASAYNHVKGKLKELNKEEFEQLPKVVKEKMPMLDKKAREHNFKEVELGFVEEQARREAERCLSCGCKDVHECKLREFATTYKAEQNRLAGAISKHPIDDSHPFITRDQNKCIMCGRCVRICHELQGAGAIGFISRGYNTVVAPSFGKAFAEESRCESCGQCVSSCPVGALVEKVHLPKPGPFVEKTISTICNYCGTGCSLEINITAGQYVRTTAQVGQGVNNGNLCTRGRFGNDFINAADRLTQPFINKNGKLVSASWEEAYQVIGEKLTKKSSKTGIYASQRLTNEELSLVKQLAQKSFNIKPASFGLRTAAFGVAKALGNKAKTATYEELKAADFIACIGFDIKEVNPVAALMVKEAAERGAELVLVYDQPSKMTRYATEVMAIKQENITCFINSCVDAIRGKEAKACECGDNEKHAQRARLVELLAGAKKPVFVIGGDISAHEAEAVAGLALAAGKADKSLLVMHGKANTQGAIDLGFEAACSKAKDAFVIFGEDPVGCGVNNAALSIKESEFTMVADVFLTETAKLADVVLPLATFAETDGTYTNSEKRTQKLNAAIPSRIGKTNAEIIAEILRVVGEKSSAAAEETCESGLPCAAADFADTVEHWFVKNSPRG
ncbi:MAG: FAD-dependent pyridine nucleotide-disulfide oxidoreductase [Firmicutes bacterium]|nr:FAD-dependent pyridine nucleotide-disulfide oxidoreductase [Bacillota bacterium]